ncbi:MAG: 1-aminocyclopropane-1-carboxylate deaminase/D-cysteine desulfhydrase [Chitinophagales bacterium]|jgi:1-aminocyclopropane-1-carboxylate deaminase|nr:1-aminocyclopropane-1-carboxylate deaminase/D-cysteine desulfhydrase [Chitinophagales bacterium]MBP9220999.1 1-aminocyclopropane-1-carboxylate deaminase/D-cysteine desulfhydrase [Chitinophagales bacterium]MBP9796433.1 1-aminocyclopropane-1-carboxylate deaminase/D-cysteine desulfhydrase [Chitinophagales bacterium]
MTPISQIKYKGHSIDILRLDLAFPEIQGNKHFKLKYNLEEAKRLSIDTLLTFGGAFSNHIHATAVAGKKYQFKTIGIIRGEDDIKNPTLQFIRNEGMELLFVSREQYKNKYDKQFLQTLEEKYGQFYLIPEGGTNNLAVKGCSEILTGLENKFDQIFCASGTGGTLAGLISTPDLKSKITGISVLKGKDILTDNIKTLLQNNNNSNNVEWNINTDYHFGGYAKYDPTLLKFIKQFENNYTIKLDPIYTAKTCYAVFDLIDKQLIPSTEKICIIHTGGLQGWMGWNYRFAR